MEAGIGEAEILILSTKKREIKERSR